MAAHYAPLSLGFSRQEHRRDGMGREEGGGIRMGNTCNPWLIHVNVWQNALQHCKVISLQLIKINERKKKEYGSRLLFPSPMHDSEK